MINRYFYKSSLLHFLTSSADEVFGVISKNDDGDSVSEQKYAWNEEINILKDSLKTWAKEDAEIIFEYSIPRLGKRIDIVLLLRNIVFVIEFKAGKNEYLQSDMEQVMDYALDLKNFHSASHNCTIVPILVATEAKQSSQKLIFSVYDDKIYNPLLSNAEFLEELISKVITNEHANQQNDNILKDWAISRYEPTPTIIEAASALYQNHSVNDITRHEAAGAMLEDTTNFVLDVIKKSKTNNEKSICFVTGVPGAGKTLVGLNVAIQQSLQDENNPEDERNLAVYLSGNGPLVTVLTAALAKDKQKKDIENGKKCYITDARREVSQFIQLIHRYRSNTLAKIKLPITNGR